MLRHQVLILACILAPAITFAQRSVVIVGSSTAAGDDASPDSSWARKLSKHYKMLGMIDTIYNRATGGRSTLECLPTDPNHLGEGIPGVPDTGRNVTKAISYRPLPLLVIISLPNNDFVGDGTVGDFLANLRTMYNYVTAAHIPCFITSTQPRNDFNTQKRKSLKEANDSILTEFPHNSADFWDTLADHTAFPDSLGIKPIFAMVDGTTHVNDGIHLNDAGQNALYTVLMQYGNVLSAPLIPLPLTLVDFNVQLEQHNALISWTTADESGPIGFHIQRSPDGDHFTDIASENAEGRTTNTYYSWTDDHILSGKSFYRLRITTDGKEEFSRIAGLFNPVKEWSVNKVYFPMGDNTLVAEMSLAQDMNLHLSVLNTSGAIVRQETAFSKAPEAHISFHLDGIAAGQYFLRIITDKGEIQTVAFTRL